MQDTCDTIQRYSFDTANGCMEKTYLASTDADFNHQVSVDDHKCCDAVDDQPNDAASLEAACSTGPVTTQEYSYSSSGCLEITFVDSQFDSEEIVNILYCCQNIANITPFD